jgi:hypothetical protein
MSDEQGKQTEEEQETEEETQESRQQHLAQTRPTQIVEIKTPLDQPEFDYFINTFMQKMGLSDRKQSAIMLTQMMYDMGIDPYSDLKDIQGAMEEMNNILKNLPNTPTAMKVKDTVGAMFAAKAGRAMTERFPRMTGQDPMMDRMERIMDKYMPMIMGMKMVGEMMRGDYPQQQKTQAQADLPDAVKTEFADLKIQVANMTELISKQREEEKEKAFAENLFEQVNAKIMPALQSLQVQVNELAKQPPTPSGPDRADELREISKEIKDAVDRMGEKAGAKQLTLADVDPLLTIITKIDEKFKKEPTGEFDWRVATISTLGETMKEGIAAYKEVQAAKAAGAGAAQGQPQSNAPANAEMAAIIRRQVQNYILGKLSTGAATMNIQDAARELGLTPEQVAWAYQTLTAEGWINVKVPVGQRPGQSSGQQKGTGSESNVEAHEEKRQNQENQPFIET